MTNVDCARLTRNNRQAKYEDEAWLEEARRWQEEHQLAAGWLARVQEVWQEAESALNAHAQAIEAHRQRLEQHEGAVARFLHDPYAGDDDSLISDHEELAWRHTETRKMHEDIQRHHQATLTEIRETLRSALSGALLLER